jgi:dTDP-4-dehydrorhamnose reductase
MQIDCNIQTSNIEKSPMPLNHPTYIVLDKTKIKETFGIEIPYWTDSLKKCLDNTSKK